MKAATTAATDPASTTTFTVALGNACTRYGSALPTVSAPTTVPTAKPRRDLNHVEIIFIAGGYTPARHTPHANRVSTAGRNPSTESSSALKPAPSSALTANSSFDGMMSARFRIAMAAVPATKPSCTLVVSHAT